MDVGRWAAPKDSIQLILVLLDGGQRVSLVLLLLLGDFGSRWRPLVQVALEFLENLPGRLKLAVLGDDVYELV